VYKGGTGTAAIQMKIVSRRPGKMFLQTTSAMKGKKRRMKSHVTINQIREMC
jgi:hypothetical protein